MARRSVYHDWVCPKCGWRYHSDRGICEATHTHQTSKTTVTVVDLRPAPAPAATQLALETA